MRLLVLRCRQLWREACTEALLQNDQDEEQQDEEFGEQQDYDEDDEDNDDAKEEQEDNEEQQLQQQDNDQEEERQEQLNQKDVSEPTEKAILQDVPEEGGVSRATEGSSEALLSDLHSFSGTAAWEDSGEHSPVTAL